MWLLSDRSQGGVCLQRLRGSIKAGGGKELQRCGGETLPQAFWYRN